MAAAIGAPEGIAEHRFFSEMEHIPPSAALHRRTSDLFAFVLCQIYAESNFSLLVSMDKNAC